MISVKNLEFRYPKSSFQLSIPDLKVKVGEKVAVIGSSGSGKTTLLNIFSGIIKVERGTVEVNGHSIKELSDADLRNLRSQQIGFIFQDFKLIEYLRVWDNIMLPFRINANLKLNDEKLVNANAIANDTGIKSKLRNYPSKLSHGERQRVAICRALVNDPKLLLADEPTGNLDPQYKHQIIDMLLSYVDRNESTLIMVTHDYELLKKFDRVIDFKQFTLSS